MILVGGYVADRSNTTNDYPKDPWPQGLGVFDMTNLVFQDRYDSNAPDYTTPQVLKDYYAENGMYPSSWDDPALADIFVRVANTSSSSSPDSTGGIGSDSEDDDDGGSSSHTGAIAGGVVGGVVGLALVGVLAWWLLRRRKNTTAYQQAHVTDNHQGARMPEKDYNEQAAMDRARHSPMPSPGVHSPGPQNGAFGTQVPYHEVHAQDIRHEVDGAGVRRGEGEAHELQ